MTRAKNGDTVKVHYRGTFDSGEVFDSSQGREPLEFRLGEGSVIPGFEAAVAGMSVGEKKTEKILSDMAYGPYFEDLAINVEKNQLPPDLMLHTGQQLEITQEDGSMVPVTITGVTETTVTLDANHPLAGKDLIFDIELVGLG